MKTRTRQASRSQEDASYQDFEDQLDLDALSEEELEALLFEEEDDKKAASKGIFNLPTVAGMSMIVVGILYLFQQLGVNILGGVNLGAIASTLPWLAGILIILLGFGVLSWRPKKKKRKTVRKEIKKPSGEKVVVESKTTRGAKKRLRRSRDKKIAGVAGGLAEYFNIDPTLVRIAFVIGTIISQGTFLFAYLLLAFIMSKPEPLSARQGDKIVITKD